MISKPPHSTPRPDALPAFGSPENDALARELGLLPPQAPEPEQASAEDVDSVFVRGAILNMISLLEFRIRMRRATDKDVTALEKCLQLSATFAKIAVAVDAVQDWRPAPKLVRSEHRSPEAQAKLDAIRADAARAAAQAAKR